MNKKRRRKQIESLQKQIGKHKEKMKEHKQEKPWLENYWKKQITTFEKRKKEKESKLKD
tara:strand:+ start:815 stop:991 length:177 start_codon:yes stop_codon:yes gene_type:complete